MNNETKPTRFERHKAECVRCQIPGYRCITGHRLIARDTHPAAWAEHSEPYTAGQR